MDNQIFPPFAPSHDGRATGHRKDIERLKRRGNGRWHNVGDSGEPAFQNSFANAGAGLQALRFRLLLGGGLEIQGSVTGGASGDVVFTLPVGFRPADELRLPASDDLGAFVMFRILASGDVIMGV